jgi:hypothetical protein
VVLVANSTRPDAVDALADALADRLGARLHSLWWNGNAERTNTILGSRWTKLRGADAVRESVRGAHVFFPPGAFGQNHLELADALVARVHEQVPEGARVAEYYAGCGPIGLGLLRRAARVVFVESAPMPCGLAMGIAARPEIEQLRAAVVAGSAGEALEARDGAQVVIVDPPRRGLDAQLAARLAADPPPLLIYVSCDLSSFRRDAAQLVAGGRARLVALEAWSLFPNTEHLETLARFTAGLRAQARLLTRRVPRARRSRRRATRDTRDRLGRPRACSWPCSVTSCISPSVSSPSGGGARGRTDRIGRVQSPMPVSSGEIHAQARQPVVHWAASGWIKHSSSLRGHA